jgi:hypothetical protein
MSSDASHDRAAGVRRSGEEPPPVGAGRTRGDLPATSKPPKAVRTFVFEVTAGRSAGVGDASDGSRLHMDPPVISPVDARALLAPGPPEERDTRDRTPSASWSLPASGSAVDVGGDADEPANEHIIHTGDLPTATRSKRPGARHRRTRLAALPKHPQENTPQAKPARRWSAWSASLVVHGALVALLSLVTITQISPREVMDLVFAPPVTDEIELPDSPEAQSQPDDNAAEGAFAELASASAGEVVDPGAPTLGMAEGAGLVGDLTDDVALVGGGGGGTETGPPGGLGGAGGLFGDGTGGLAEFGSGLGAEATAKFFGTKIEGRRIVFVLDNSGSMQGGRLETVIAELLRTLDALTDKQEFYIIFYSDAAYPLFYPDPAQDYLRPTDRNKGRVAEWLDKVELCLGDAVVEALTAAASIEPDTVFLLSDGRIQGDRKMAFLLNANDGAFRIHTVGVGLGNGPTARQNLQDIAQANGGEFRETEIPEEMRQLARQSPRPYHNKNPGPIWGRNVKPWGGR